MEFVRELLAHWTSTILGLSPGGWAVALAVVGALWLVTWLVETRRS